MNVYILFGQRICAYPNQYTPEALEVIEENGHIDNPEFLSGELAKYEASKEFEALRIVKVNLGDDTDAFCAQVFGPVAIKGAMEL